MFKYEIERLESSLEKSVEYFAKEHSYMSEDGFKTYLEMHADLAISIHDLKKKMDNESKPKSMDELLKGAPLYSMEEIERLCP